MDRKLWEPLQRFESRDYITSHYQERHGRKLNAQRSHEIGSCFAQGREYFVSASTASDTVKPLLLYYGIASLARGATLLKSRDKQEESLTPGHGLSTIEWSKTLHNGIENVLDLSVAATKGTFSEFVEAIGNGQSYCWRDKDGRPGFFKNDFGELRFLSDGSVLTLGELFSRERDLADEYQIATGAWGNTNFGWVMTLEQSLRILFLPVHNVDMAKSIESYGFPTSAIISVQELASLSPIPMIAVDIPAIGEDSKKLLPLAIEQDTNIGWLIRPLKNGDNVIDLHRIYIESFILGMLSRYFPSKWMSILRSDKGDIARSVILASISRIEGVFPKLLRDQLH